MKCTVFYNDTSKIATPNKMTFFDELYLDYKVIDALDCKKLSLFLHPKEKIKLSKVVVEIPYTFQPTDKVFCNGFQSWSESKTYQITESIPQLRKFVKPLFRFYGDDHILNEAKPALYSWTYGYVRQKGQIFFIGSISENTAYTFIEYEIQANLLRLTKLCDDIELSHSFPVFDLVHSVGQEKQVFDSYFSAMPATAKSMNTTFGWTSWYRHYTKITAQKIEGDLEAFSVFSDTEPFNTYDRIFQIDDGYQESIGDWLQIKSAFPKGMAAIASKIKSKDLVPGIWVAPFICSGKSKVFANHKDWLLKDEKGRLLKAGYNPLWDGWYYALDIYNQKVRDHLTEVFFTFTEKWGFQLIKADFLFAACITAPKDRTKAQVMFDAMTFLEQLIGKNKLLACGAPIGSTFQKAAFCRIGPDTHLGWRNGFMRFLRKRERVSTISALRTIISRRHLNKKVFVNDPDVFIMRPKGHRLNSTQQFTLLLVQILFGSQIFNSDDWSAYEEDTIEEIKGVMKFVDPRIIHVSEPQQDYFNIHFQKNGDFIAYINLNSKKITTSSQGNSFELGAHESFVLIKKDKFV